MNKKNGLILIFFFLCTYVNAQDYYERSIDGAEESWHKVILPDAVFEKTKNDFSDIRVFGLNSSGEKIEQPFLLKRNTPTKNEVTYPFEIINRSSKGNEHFFTFKLKKVQTLNQIELDFKETNFDWKVQLEGSMDQKEWFEVLKDYRILSIQNEATNYQFSKLRFEPINYPYLRLSILYNNQLDLQNATLSTIEKVAGKEKTWSPIYMAQLPEKNTKQSILSMDLEEKVPLSFIKIKVEADYDYYRSFTLQCLIDSTETPKGWKYNWRTISNGVLSSIEENEFSFTQVVTNKLRLRIRNEDNQMLPISRATLGGYEHELEVRFDGQAPFTLQYGNHTLQRPSYDIANFKNKIPSDLTAVKIGPEKAIKGTSKKTDTPLFENKAWLWGIMLLIILVLGGFTIKMMRGEGLEK